MLINEQVIISIEAALNSLIGNRTQAAQRVANKMLMNLINSNEAAANSIVNVSLSVNGWVVTIK